MNSAQEDILKFIHKAQSKTLKVGILGLGYVGLPLAVSLSEIGFEIVGFDIDQVLVATLDEGYSQVEAVSEERLKKCDVHFTSSVDCLKNLDVYIICVPTPLDEYRRPQNRYVEAASYTIREALNHSCESTKLVVLESTVSPGTTRKMVANITSRPGVYQAFAPERENPGNADFDTTTIPRVVGGVCPDSLRIASAFYSQLTSVYETESSEVAECAKLLENIYRLVNIALVNQLREVFHELGVDSRSVIEAAATKPFGFQRFDPGPGVGGHCIPIDPFYLTHELRARGLSSSIIEAAGEVVARTPHYIVQRIAEILSDKLIPLRGTKILLVGVSYKPNVADYRESPALEIMAELRRRGAEVSFFDPVVSTIRVNGEVETSSYETKADCAVILSDHDSICYDTLFADVCKRHRRILIDTRGRLRKRNLLDSNTQVFEI